MYNFVHFFRLVFKSGLSDVILDLLASEQHVSNLSSEFNGIFGRTVKSVDTVTFKKQYFNM